MSNVPRREADSQRGSFTHSTEIKDSMPNGTGVDNRFSGGDFTPTMISGKGRAGTDSGDRM